MVRGRKEREEEEGHTPNDPQSPQLLKFPLHPIAPCAGDQAFMTLGDIPDPNYYHEEFDRH
jgi:hypothetical protein